MSDGAPDKNQGPVPSAPMNERDQLTASALVVAAMSVIATIGFGTIFSSWSFIAPAIAGAALGALIVVVGRLRGLILGEIIGLALLASLIIGPLAVGGREFYRGAIVGWSDILSATPPIDATVQLKALPFIAAFIGALAGTELVRLRTLPGIAVVGPIGTLTLTALFSDQTRNGAITVGLVLLLGLLLIARLHHASLSATGIVVLGLVLGLVAAVASSASLFLPFADESARIDLRDLQTPPWDPLAEASPLTQVKAGLKGASDTEQVPLLRITGDEPMSRWRLASLPAFNGIYWGVGEAGSVTEFVQVDSLLPSIEGEAARNDSLSFAVDVLEPAGAWVPSGGVPTAIDFRDDTDVRMNLLTGTIGLPNHLQPGNSYELTVAPWATLSDADLAGVVFEADSRAAELELLPPLVRNLAADFSTGLDQLSGARVAAIRDNFRLGSYSLDVAPGHAFGRVADFLQPVELGQRQESDEALRALVGYEETYAAAAAVLTRLSDIPTRVAVGYILPDDRWENRSAEVFASDVNAWIEVSVDGVGWVPIDVTPDRQREPEDANDGSDTRNVPVADPPTSPPEPEEEDQAEIDEPEEEPEAEEEPEEEPEEADPPTVIVRAVALAAAGIAVGLMVLALFGIVLWKYVRQRRRRNAATAGSRVVGAWAELVDRIDEVGGELPKGATPAEAARFAQSIDVLATPEATERVVLLADQVSIAAFHPAPPTAEAAEDAWRTYDELAQALREGAGPAERVKRVLDPRPLRDDSLVGAP